MHPLGPARAEPGCGSSAGTPPFLAIATRPAGSDRLQGLRTRRRDPDLALFSGLNYLRPGVYVITGTLNISDGSTLLGGVTWQGTEWTQAVAPVHLSGSMTFNTTATE